MTDGTVLGAIPEREAHKDAELEGADSRKVPHMPNMDCEAARVLQ